MRLAFLKAIWRSNEPNAVFCELGEDRQTRKAPEIITSENALREKLSSRWQYRLADQWEGLQVSEGEIMNALIACDRLRRSRMLPVTVNNALTPR